jgi:hypothetical protein
VTGVYREESCSLWTEANAARIRAFSERRVIRSELQAYGTEHCGPGKRGAGWPLCRSDCWEDCGEPVQVALTKIARMIALESRK